ncbi:MAG: GDCCVxC domain-containing (seleno)protein [Bacteroidota bacterium]
MAGKLKLKSIIKCPVCKYTKEVPMLLYTRRMQYDCEACNARLKPKPVECCVFCVYGTVPCPSVQQDNFDQHDFPQD